MQITNYQELIGDPKIVAKFDVYLGPSSTITYPNFKVLKNKGGGWYVRRPSYVKSEDARGEKVWGSYPEMSEENWKSLSSQVTELLKPFVNKPVPF